MKRNNNIFLRHLVLLMFGVVWSSSAWSQAVSQLSTLTSGVYELQNISNESGTGTGRGYLVNYTSASSGIGLADCTYSQYRGGHPTEKNSATTCSYWYLHKNDNGSFTIVSLSTLGGNTQPRFIQVGNPSSLITTERELVFADATNANHVRNGKKGIVIANKTESNQYMSAACGTNSANNCIKRTTTITDGGNPWLFIPVLESQLTEGQKAIRAKYLERFAHLTNGVTINFQDPNGNPITGETVVYTPTVGAPVNISSSAGTYNFGDVLYDPSLFSIADFTKNLRVAYNDVSKILTFTITQNKWYYIMCRNGNPYVSSDYVNGNGEMMLNNSNKPTDYKGLWMEIPTTDLDANGQGTVYFINAYYGDTRILAITGSGANASAKMYSKTDVPVGAITLFDRKYRADRDGAFFFKSARSANNYLNRNQNKFAFWDSPNAYNNPDNGSTFDHTEVPNLPNNASIQFVAASSSVNIPADFKVNYNASEYYRMVSGASQFFPATNNIVLANNQNYDFGNVPFLSAAFSVNKADLRILNVEMEGRTVKFIIDRLPAIIHRPHGTFTHLSTVSDDKKPNSKFIQEGKGLIDHPYADNFTDAAGYTDNDRKMQNTSVFHVTQYTTKGGTTTVALPHTRTGGLGKINKYQRIYNYLTERPLDEGIISGMSGYTLYSNGHARIGNIKGALTITLPSDMDEITIGVDDSEFNDFSTDSNGNLTEPSLSMRTIIHIVSAEKMASALEPEGGNKWWEEKTYIVPNIKHGSATHRNNADLLPLDMPFSNYWIYDNSHNPMRIVAENGNYNTLSNNLSIEVEGTAASYITADIFKDANGPGLHSPLGVAYNHFIYYKVKGEGLTREVPVGRQAIIKVYARNGVSGTKYQLAKFTLNFQADCEPLAITSVVGNPNSTRSRDYFKSLQMAEVASLTFSEKRVDFKGFGGVGGNSNHYAFPLDPTRTSYAFSPDDAFGGYRITKQAYGMKALPVSLYERNIKNQSSSLTVDDDDYYLYIDAAEAPGQVASIPLDGNLCAGTRLFFYGWLNSQNPFESGNATAASVILELVGRKGGKDVTLATYLPGVVSDAAYTPEGTVIRSVKDGSKASTEAAYSFSYNLNGHGDDQTRLAAWQSIGFSYLLTESGFDGFELRVINNCYSTAGGDYSLDDFRVFANPPKGDLDFTTPLCSDKVRHAKIHADYDMLKSLSESGVNEEETPDEWDINISYCFVDSVIFDEYVDPGIGIPVKELFDKDENGNHILKPGLSYTITQIETAINHAFGKALVGRRCTKEKKDSEGNSYEDHGLHSYKIDKVYENIPIYAYNDSKNEVVYRETGKDGINRIVFKEDVVRGEMYIRKDENDNNREFYPHLRPSRTYYLVFALAPITEADLTSDKIDKIATNVFDIESECSYFGTFITKNPLHVILDNADIESDLPVKAVCHGEEVEFAFDMPAMKLEKNYPIIDEEYCTSDESLDGHIVPSTNGAKHYRYESVFTTSAVYDVIKNMPYDWWLGGELGGKKFGGKIEDYLGATHPSIKYNEPKDKTNKKHDDPVSIAQAMTDFRFFYPDVDKSNLSTVTKKNYNSETGYGLLDSEIQTIIDFVNAGIIVLKKTQYSMSLTAGKSKELTQDELSKMTSNELNAQILNLAITLDDDSSIAALKPLKDLEAATLKEISEDGRKELTFQEFAYEPYVQVKLMAENLISSGDLKDITPEQISTIPESQLRKAVENALRTMTPAKLEEFAINNFTDIGPERRAHLVIRALNIMAVEAAKDPSITDMRDHLRNKMIKIFSAQKVQVLKKMWSDAAVKLTEEERANLLGDKTPESMSQQELATAIEGALAVITNNIITDLNSDKYIHFTLVPIMPSQENFVDEPYIFCPEPRGVKIRITGHEPTMLDGFADMAYPEDMKNVPVRLGMKQISETLTSSSKNLHIPVRGLKPASEKGVRAVRLTNTGYANYLFLANTDDPFYKQDNTAIGMAEAKNFNGTYTKMVGIIRNMVAKYPTAEQPTPDNYLVVQFDKDMKFREGYTYRVGINFMENDSEDNPTISCYGTMYLDLKIVPEYQKWTAGEGNTDWTNDRNWVRADREELNAGNTASDGTKPLDTYITNEDNQTDNSFVPMYFTNVLLDNKATAPVLYSGLTAASRSGKTFLTGLNGTATPLIIYDMEVMPADGTWHAMGNYECGLFGTYIANGVTFTPGAQMGNAHLLKYNKAWVEYELDSNRWYTIGSPLKNSFAGDWYSPTLGGKQVTPHFYDITYNEELNDRFRPAYYQRSWDRDGNNIVYMKSGSTYDSYVKADWSNVYNDAKVNYSAGGFSVKAELDYMTPADRPADGKVLVRLPKADTSYKYFDVNGSTGQAADAQMGNRTQSYRLLSDDLQTDGSGTITMSVSNQTPDNNFLLLSNPFMAAMDMDAFFAANTDLEAQYWIVTADRQVVSVKSASDGEWITTGMTGGRYVAPLQGFFVKKKSGAANQNTIKASYTAAMQTTVYNENSPIMTRAAATSDVEGRKSLIRLIASRNGASSTALIILSDNAQDAYSANEDCETFIDGNLYDNPTVYTSAGTMAQTINVRKTLDMVPVGIISSDNSEATLSFSISSNDIAPTLFLYDNEQNEYTQINNDTQITMSGNNSGRYFITMSTKDSINTINAEEARKGVWTISGQYCGETVKGMTPGLYIVDGVKMVIK